MLGLSLGVRFDPTTSTTKEGGSWLVADEDLLNLGGLNRFLLGWRGLFLGKGPLSSSLLAEGLLCDWVLDLII